MSSVWQFLVSNGVVSAVLRYAVIALLGVLVKYVREHVKQQKRIEGLLDTRTPGGLRDVVDAIERNE